MVFSDVLKSVIETLSMSSIALLLSYLVGMPMGLILNITSKNGIKTNKIINFILSLIVNILRSIPCLIIVVLTMPLVRSIFGTATGKWYTIIIPLFITSVGFVSRLVEQSLAEVDKGKIEAIISLGASKMQIITKVLLPEARSSLLSGAIVTFVSIIGYTSFAYNISAGGIIAKIWSYYIKNTGSAFKDIMFWLLIIIVIVLVQLIQELGLFIAKKIDKRRI